MHSIRTPAVAGTFYPGNARELRAQVQNLLQHAVAVHAAAPPRALIAPHAGYIYSGAIAASAYAQLGTARQHIQRVLLLGPSHRVGFRGLALSGMSAFATPLGTVTLDQVALTELGALPAVGLLEAAHAQEHSLEVHLPFLQELLGSFSLIPVVVGDASPPQVGAVLEAFWDDPATLIVISSDLSHYHDYQTAQTLDRATSAAIAELRFNDIGSEQACGCNPINGLLWLAQQKGLSVTNVDLRNSGDTAGSRERVVGYGGYVVH